MAVFTCPQCGHSQAVDDKHIGKNATCPKCKTQNTVRGESKPFALVPDTHVVETHAEVVHRAVGPLGIRCDSWVDSKRHINKRSSLHVESWTVIDHSLPLRFTKHCDILVHNQADNYPLDLYYQALFAVKCFDEAVTAFETRHMTFNIWGQHVTTMSCCTVQDLQPGDDVNPRPAWHLYSETEAEEFSASLSFISRVRLQSGMLRTADTAFVLREAQRIAEKVTEEDLEQKPPKRS